MSNADNKLTRIGVFYDGNFFSHVSNFYRYKHSRKARISISGLHEFIRKKVSDYEGVDQKSCQIVQAHYFRGRLRAQDAEQRDVLLKERKFDDLLRRERITAHYRPLASGAEKGVDVSLALEAFELAIHKRYDICVLIASDGDFVPLVQKLKTVGTRAMLLAWDFKFVDQSSHESETRTSQSLLDEVAYPILMHQVIDDRTKRNDSLINGIFVPKLDPIKRSEIADEVVARSTKAEIFSGKIQNLKEGFGFIKPTTGTSNLFFFHAAVLNADFSGLNVGDSVEYEIGRNEKGECAVNVKVIAEDEAMKAFPVHPAIPPNWRSPNLRPAAPPRC